MKGKVEVKIPPTADITIIRQGVKNVFEEGRDIEAYLEKTLKPFFPDINVRCSNFQTIGLISSRFYEIKIGYPLEELKEFGEMVQKKVEEFLKNKGENQK